ncbi:1-deoxy-D-xylulose-5-phosphate reductoisomerase [Uliginosibacterium sp. 31-16]|uniref:1-deoxy-D-xylulose-5-phosphate reductoisomerase n=1 Tax=Uliginosibacterium sp. 31-16 TaxID=3068315 RepID=UPI00273F9343|nr:1-deoxy-D-xylulose-5-phosphate reductoisomerase [Uliginosibacterium sp. 31-16]MDP5240515.1 1-deoxy-D-xylulose-5-phosphate reductoisomerase [Uliginosibacterium sp. 31-16]
MISKQVLTVLGATGSIGLSTLDVVARHPERYEVFALSAHRQVGKLAELCRRFRPRHAVVAGEQEAVELRRMLSDLPALSIMYGPEALGQIASASEVTTVMAAIVGAAGLGSSLAAARAGKRVLLANKEALVMAGDLFIASLNRAGGSLLPIDSEHNAVFQSLPAGFDYGLKHCGVRKVVLTASGGPFRETPLEKFAFVTPEQACAHPNWSMGRKISVDSATMMNKGLEVIEASWIFGVEAERIEVLIHPESVIHSMVQYEDGAVLAELGHPDMRTPIAHALAYPERIASGVASLDLVKISKLSFEAPDLSRFPCLQLAYDALRAGGSAPAILNAANEEAVAAFLQGNLRFDRIPVVIAETLEQVPTCPLSSLEEVFHADARARDASRHLLARERAFCA